MATIARLVAELGLDDSDFQKGLKRSSSSLAEWGKRVERAGQQLSLKLTAPITGLGFAAMRTFGGFNDQITNIAALVGVPAAELEKLRQQVLDLAPAVGIGPAQLAEALYFITSAGIPASNAMSVLEASAKAAAAGLGDVVTVADVTTSAMNAYAESGLTANDAVSVLVATVREGKAEPQELAASLGQVIPTAAQMGVEFHEVGAAMAVMTQSGLGAAEAGTSLNQVMLTLMSPSRETAKTLEKFGLSAEGLRQQLREKGLLSVLRTLATTLGDDQEAIANVFGNVRALRGFLNITGQDAEKVDQIFKELANSTGDLDKAFEIAASDPMFKLQQAMARIKVALVQIGAAMVPVVVPAIELLSKVVATLAGWFDKLPKPVKIVIVVLAGLLAALGPVLVALGIAAQAIAALIPLLPALGAAISAALGPVGLVIMAIVAALALLAVAYKKNWLGFGDAVRFVARAVAGWIRDIVGWFEHLWSRIRAFFKAVDLISRGKPLQGMLALGPVGKTVMRLALLFGKVYRPIRLFLEGLRKIGGRDTERVHKILNQLPAPLAKILIAFARVIRIVKRFRAAWEKGGPVLAFRVLSRELEKFGRTIGNFFKSIGFERFGSLIAEIAGKIGRIIRDVVKLVDDLVHGNWSAAWRDFVRLGKDAIDLFVLFFKGVPSALADAFNLILNAIRAVDWGGVVSFLLTKGGELISGLYNGAIGFATGTLFPWLGGLLPQVPGAVGDALGWLVAKGEDLLTGLWNGIKNIWDNTIKPFFEKFPSRVAGLFPDNTGERLLGTGRRILGGLWNGIKDIWDNTIKPFFSGIVDRIVGVMPVLAELAGPLINAGKSILNGIWNGISWVWDNVVEPFFSGIVDAVFNAIPGWDEILKILKPVGENFIKAIKQGIEEAWNAVLAIFNAMPAAVDAAISTLKDVKQWLDDVLGLAEKVLGKLGDIAKWLGGKLGIGGGDGGGEGAAGLPSGGVMVAPSFSGETTLTTISQWVTDVLAEFDKLNRWVIPPVTGQGAVGNIKSMHPPAFEGSTVKTSIQQWVTDVLAEFDKLKTWVTPPLTEGGVPNVRVMVPLSFAGSTVKTTITTWVDDVLAEFDRLKAWIIPPVSGEGAVGNIMTMYPPAFDGGTVKTTIQTWVSDVLAEFDKLNAWVIPPVTGSGAVGSVLTMYPPAFDGSTVKTIVEQWVKDVTQLFKDLNTAIDTISKDIKQNVIDQMTSMATGAKDKATALKNDVSKAFADMYDVIDDSVSDAHDAVVDALTFDSFYDEGYDVGYSLGQGINNGIAAWTSAIKWTAWNAVNQAVQAAKQAAGIASPSKVMEQMGRYLMAGLERGIRLNAESPAEAMAAALQPVLAAPVRVAPGGNATYTVTINVSGAGDPEAVARATFAEFSRQLRKR